jgi:hypothetical protein
MVDGRKGSSVSVVAVKQQAGECNGQGMSDITSTVEQ